MPPTKPRESLETPQAGRRLQLLVLAVIGLAFVAFRTDALLRVEGPLIADSVEYLLITHDLLTDSDVPVSPVRNCFFSTLVAGQFLLQGLVLEGPFGAGSGRALPVLFHVLAVVGAYRLAKEIHDRRAGALAALFVAVLPAFGYWATDCLTDVPAAACFVWAVLWWLRGKPVASGVAMGICVLLRYQAGVCLVALLGAALCSSRRKSLVRVLPGLLLVPLGLRVLDAWYWGEPFLSFKEHFSVFSGHLGTSVERHGGGVAAPGGESSAGILAMAYGAFARAIRSDFVTRGPETLTWILTVLFASYAIIRPRIANRGAGDVAFVVCAATFLLLCLFTYDDLRYLTSITPLVAAVGAAAAVPWIDGIAGLIGRARASTVGLGVLGVVFCGLAWSQQQRLQYRPFNAVLEAVEGVFSPDEPRTIGMIMPWVTPHRYRIDELEFGSWITPEGASFVDLWYLEKVWAGDPEALRESGFAEGVLRDLDYLVIGGWSPRWEKGSFLWRHLNGRAELDEVFYDRAENEHAAWRFRVRGLREGDRPFFEVLDEPRGEPLAEFDGGVSLIDLVASEEPGTPGALRIDFTWRVDETVNSDRRARVRLLVDGVHVMLPDVHFVLPPGGGSIPGIASPGSTVRVSRYLEYGPFGEQPGFTIGVTVFARVDSRHGSELTAMEIIQTRSSGDGGAEGLTELQLEITPTVGEPR